MSKNIAYFILLIGVSISAQSIQITGFVKDSLQTPLDMANVIAYKATDSAMVAYGITNDKGRYKLVVPKNNTYFLKVSFIGLTTTDKTISVTDQDRSIDFMMVSEASNLDEVEIVYEMPVVVKGDTLIYNTDSFTNGTEKKLGDVLDKLPGVEVNDNGEIEVEGKRVSKVMVEGKDFFDGDSKLATKNIPADALDKVEVVKNYENVSQMRGLRNHQDQIAINIKLKEGKKNFWFGDVEAGSGIADTERYLIKPKLFYYSPKYSVNLLTDFNDIGELPFTMLDYFKFTGGFKNLENGTSFNISSNDLAFSFLENNRANEIGTKFGAANFSLTATKALDISGYAIISSNKTNFITNTTNTYIDDTPDPNDNIIEQTFDTKEQRSEFGLLKLNAIYKPNTKFRLDCDIFSKLSNQQQENDFLSNRNTISEAITINLKNTQYSIQQNTNVYYTVNDKNIFSLATQYKIQKENPFYNVIRSQIPFRGIFTQIDNSSIEIFDPLLLSDRYDINQQKNVKTNALDSKLDYYYILNKKSNFNLTLGVSNTLQNFKSTIFQILEGGVRNEFIDAQFKNDVNYNFTDTYVGLHYKFITGIFTFNPGVNLHNYNLIDTQLGTTIRQNEWQLLPDIFALVEFKKSETLQFNYSITADYTDIKRLARGYVINNYNSLSRGNRFLENALYDKYSLSYSKFNMFNYTTIYVGLRYDNQRNPIKRTTNFSGINNVNTSVNSNLEDQILSVNGRIGKNFGKIKSDLTLGIRRSSFNNIINTLKSKSINFNQNYGTKWATNFSNGPNFDFGYDITINEYDNNGVKSKFYTNKPFVGLDWVFGKGFMLKSSLSYYNYKNELRVLNEYSFLDAELYYQKPSSNWEYKVSVSNLLYTKSINTDYFNELYNGTSSSVVQPRYFMITMKYNL